jgi:hypothetical protein
MRNTLRFSVTSAVSPILLFSYVIQEQRGLKKEGEAKSETRLREFLVLIEQPLKANIMRLTKAFVLI